MIRIDKKNKIFLHYLIGGSGVVAYLMFIFFFVWVYVFTGNFRSIAADPSIADDLISGRAEVLISLTFLSLILSPYYYVLLFSKKIYHDIDGGVNYRQM